MNQINIDTTKKIDKNYFRNELISLSESLNGKPILLTGRYKHTPNKEWVVFTTIRKFNCWKKENTLCSHINLKRKDTDLYYILNENDHNKKFYINGHISTYEHYGFIRGSIQLCGTGLTKERAGL